MFKNYLRDEADRTDWRYAPLQAIYFSNIAPAFLMLAEFDPLLDEGIAYADKLKIAGVSTRVQIYSGMIHYFAHLGNIVNEANQVRKDLAHVLKNVFYKGQNKS
ncbi:MAG: alpha/beta hydrolase fold domain-containing protein [Nitrosomonas sp.]|nr:alpha/beta hydrolase fold domain-containing protein [Nitrosomonas sp.]